MATATRTGAATLADSLRPHPVSTLSSPCSSPEVARRAGGAASALPAASDDDLLELLRLSMPGAEEEEQDAPASAQPDASDHKHTVQLLYGLSGRHPAAAPAPPAGDGKPQGLRGMLSRFQRASADDVPGNADRAPEATQPRADARTKGAGWFGRLGRGPSPEGAAIAALPPPPPPPPGAPILPALPFALTDAGTAGRSFERSRSDTLSSSAGSASEPGGGTPPAPSSMVGASALSSLATSPAGAPPLPPGAKGHRRRGSLSASIGQSIGQALKLKRRGGTSVGSADELGGQEDRSCKVTPRGPELQGAAKPGTTPQTISCFGLTARHSFEEDEEVAAAPSANELPGPVLPPGLRGLVNTGNSCFINVAVQCLRHTPGLPLLLLPDLLRRAPAPGHAPQQEPAAAAGGELAGGQLGPSPVPSPAATPHESGAEGQPAAAASSLGGDPSCGAAQPEATPHLESHQMDVATISTLSTSSSLTEDSLEDGNACPAELQGSVPGAAGVSADRGSSADPEPAAAPGPCPGKSPKQDPPPRGAMLGAFTQLVEELYLGGGSSAVDPGKLLRTLHAFPVAADYMDGGQHDCQEMLRLVLNLLHDDLKPEQPPAPAAEAQPEAEPSELAEPPAQLAADASGPSELERSQAGSQEVGAPAPASPDKEGDAGKKESEGEKADRLWRQYLLHDDSPVSRLFGGQLQSSVTCHNCGSRSTQYEPFWDLQLPLAKEGKASGRSWLGLKGQPTSIHDCLGLFMGDERLEGDEAFSCDTCRGKTPATKHLRLQRLPEVLVLHIKRFKYMDNGTGDKLTAAVSFPLRGLRLHEYASPEARWAAAGQGQGQGHGQGEYDLFAVSNHFGTLGGGHYTAACRVPAAGGGGDWYSFNDEVITKISQQQVVSQNAYILFYAQRRYLSGRASRAGSGSAETPPPG